MYFDIKRLRMNYHQSIYTEMTSCQVRHLQQTCDIRCSLWIRLLRKIERQHQRFRKKHCVENNS